LETEAQLSELQQYQDGFIFSNARFPCIISAIGTGKTFALLVKAVKHCEENDNAKALIVRKEFTDLVDSTIQDFNQYFGANVTKSTREHNFANGSKIIFRHGNQNDLSVLKNMNLSFVGIEQAEEYDNDEVFVFLRDRMRRAGKERVIALIANARGQNWIWEMWVNQAEVVEDYNYETGESYYKRGDKRYECWTANTFANAVNLPADFVEDMKHMEVEAPNHYLQYIMNDFTALEDTDCLFTSAELQKAVKQEFMYDESKRDACILGIDIARYGEDSSVAVILQQKGPQHFEEIYFEKWGAQDLMYTTGRVMDFISRYKPVITVVDGDGMGSGVVDRLLENKARVKEYRGGTRKHMGQPERYTNQKSEDYFKIKDLVSKGQLKIKSEVLGEAQTIRYFFDSYGRKGILSKEKMRSEGIKSPDHMDALMMACSEIQNLSFEYAKNSFVKQEYYPEANLYADIR
jgi:hypothetical protein